MALFSLNRLVSAALLSSASVLMACAITAQASSAPLMEYKSKAFSGKMPADWRVDRFDFKDFSIYQVLDGTIAEGTNIEVFAVYDGKSIKELNMSPASMRKCAVDGMRLTFGRSEASASQSGMYHIVIETGSGDTRRYVHAFSTMLNLSSPEDLAKWDISLSFNDVPLSALVCPQ